MSVTVTVCDVECGSSVSSYGNGRYVTSVMVAVAISMVFINLNKMESNQVSVYVQVNHYTIEAL